MKKLVRLATVAALALTLALPTGPMAAPLSKLGDPVLNLDTAYDAGGAVVEQARYRGGGRYVGRHYSGVRHWNGGRYVGRYNGRGWYGGRHWYGPRRGYGWGWPGYGVGAGIVGLGIGAAIANDRYNNRYDYQYADDHYARCEARYRSYDPASDTFLGNDGRRHRCNL